MVLPSIRDGLRDCGLRIPNSSGLYKPGMWTWESASLDTRSPTDRAGCWVVSSIKMQLVGVFFVCDFSDIYRRKKVSLSF